MSYELERFAITEYFKAQWAGATPVGYDGHEFTAVANSVRLTIRDGTPRQGSIGRMQNVIHYLGTLTVTIYTQGGKGSAIDRAYRETISAMFFNKSIDQAGALITSMTDTLVRFSPPQLGDNRHPYIGADFDEPPLHITNIIAPFVRYGLR